MYNLESDPRLKNMNPVKLMIIKEIASGAQAKSIEQMLPEVMRINKELQKRNLAFSKQETNIIIDILMEQSSPADRQKLSMLRGMMSL